MGEVFFNPYQIKYNGKFFELWYLCFGYQKIWKDFFEQCNSLTYSGWTAVSLFHGTFATKATDERRQNWKPIERENITIVVWKLN